MFDRLRKTASDLDPEIEVEFYVLSSGIADIVRATRIAGNFKTIWGCEFHFNQDGEIDFPKRIISHIEKLRQLSQGYHGEQQTAPPNQVFRDVPPEDLHLPLDQVIYVGDGASDLPAFGMMAEHGGITLGIFTSETPQGWESASRLGAAGRVSNEATPDYQEDSELMRSLTLGVERICKQIALRELSIGE